METGLETNKDYYIISAHTNQHFYAALHDCGKNSRYVYTWINSSDIACLESKNMWRLETLNGGETYYLFNMQFREYLYAADDKWGDKDKKLRRKVLTRKDKTRPSGGEWRIEVDNKGEVKFWNVKHNGYLYVSDRKFREKRRLVYMHNALLLEEYKAAFKLVPVNDEGYALANSFKESK